MPTWWKKAADIGCIYDSRDVIPCATLIRKTDKDMQRERETKQRMLNFTNVEKVCEEC